MKIVSPLLKRVVYPGLSRSGYLRSMARSEPVVVTYHRVLPEGYKPQGTRLDGHLVSADRFRSQIQFLKAQYNLISPEQFRLWCEGRASLPSRSVLLTCDDGLLNTLTDMLPIVLELEAPFLFFVTAASSYEHSFMLWHERLELWLLQIGSSISLRVPWRQEAYVARGAQQIGCLWLELRRKLSTVDQNTRAIILEDMRTQIGISEGWCSEYSQNESLRRRFFVLNRKQIQGLANAGMAVGAHTVSHPMLSQMPEELAFREIAESRRMLEELLGVPVWAFAYPFGNPGSVGPREMTMARRAGFTCAFMNVEDPACRDMFALPRIHVCADMGLPELDAHLCGFYQSVRKKYAAVSGGSVA